MDAPRFLGRCPSLDLKLAFGLLRISASRKAGFRKLVLNATVWTAGMEVPEYGVKSTPLTDADLNANLDDKGREANLTVPKPGEFKAIPAANIDTKREAKFGQP